MRASRHYLQGCAKHPLLRALRKKLSSRPHCSNFSTVPCRPIIRCSRRAWLHVVAMPLRKSSAAQITARL